jgi:ABC-2 type transport system permease protein
MTVFRGYLKIISKNMGVIITYTAIFLAISLLITALMPEKQKASFQAEKLNITIVDEDDSPISQGLTEYLSKTSNVTFSDMDKEELSRKLYARDTEYILRIPDGFGENFLEDNSLLDATKLPDSSAAFFVDSLVDGFLSTASSYIKAGYTQEEAVTKTLRALDVEPDVTIMDTGRLDENSRANYSYTFMYFPYLYVTLMIYCISFVLMAFSGREIRRRMLSSPISSTKQTLQAILAFSLVFLAFWSISLLMPLAMKNGADFYTSPLAGYYILNSLALLLVSVAIGFLVGSLVKSSEAVAAVSNIVGLGFCFLCGVFVPMEYLGKGVTQISQFLPVYWYETANEILATHTSLSAENLQQVLQSVGIQGAYALALIVITLFIMKQKNREA